MNDNKLSLDGRLACAASLVRDGAAVADVGTDHAYLPIFLLTSGKIAFALATDVNIGPLHTAQANAEKYGTADKMAFGIADGVDDSLAEKYKINDIIVCGMGGELIARIVTSSDYTKKSGVRLVLQPMSRADVLRKFLLSEGYNILDEKLCRSAGKVYSVISAGYDGRTREYDTAQLLLGKKNIENNDPLLAEYAKKIENALVKQINGKTLGGLDCAEEKRRLDALRTAAKSEEI